MPKGRCCQIQLKLVWEILFYPINMSNWHTSTFGQVHTHTHTSSKSIHISTNFGVIMLIITDSNQLCIPSSLAHTQKLFSLLETYKYTTILLSHLPTEHTLEMGWGCIGKGSREKESVSDEGKKKLNRERKEKMLFRHYKSVFFTLK